jgi:hypothetical protein
MTVKLANNATFEFIEAFEGEEFYNNANRRVLTISCDKDAMGLDDLNNLLTETSLSSISLINEELQTTNILEGYVLKLAVGIKQKVTPQVDAPNIVEDYIEIKLAKRTYIEQQLFDLGIG